MTSDMPVPESQPTSVPAPRQPVNGELVWPTETAADAHPTHSGVGAYLHAFRRRGLVAVFLGLLLAAVAAPVVWTTGQPSYTATAAFHIASREATILFAADRDVATFDIYKSTQRQYLTSRYVLIAALRDAELADLSTLHEEPDPVGWLARNVRVNFPGDAEIMHVSLRGDDPAEAAALVNAVIDAYLTEIVDVEQGRRRERLNDLEQIHSEKESELRTKRSQLKQLAEQLGSSDRDALNLRAQLAMQQFAAFRGELSKVQMQLMRMRGELQTRENALERAEQLELSEESLDRALAADMLGTHLQRDLDDVIERQARLQDSPFPSEEDQRHFERQENRLREQLETRRDELRENRMRRTINAKRLEVQQLRQEMALVTEQEEQLMAEVVRAREHAESFGGSSIDIEMLRSEIELVEGTLRTVAQEREKLLIALRNRPRINLIHRATPPAAPDGDNQAQKAVMAGLAGFALPIVLLLWWDVRRRRVNSPDEVSPGTGLNVLAGLPLLPPRLLRDSSTRLSPRHRRLRDVFDETIDGIAVRLLHLAERDTMRVILVSSAVSGEGKTTIATQLAVALARTAHRTLLVDFDLRRPAIHQLLDLPLEPGVTEALYGHAPLDEALQSSEIEHLGILTAGRGGSGHLGVLSNGNLGSLFEHLRERFEFIVIDGSPILPVADTRLLCRHIDGVLMCVLRDVSSVPDIQAACQVLAGFAVEPLGAIVTASGSSDYRHYRYA